MLQELLYYVALPAAVVYGAVKLTQWQFRSHFNLTLKMVNKEIEDDNDHAAVNKQKQKKGNESEFKQNQDNGSDVKHTSENINSKKEGDDSDIDTNATKFDTSNGNVANGNKNESNKSKNKNAAEYNRLIAEQPAEIIKTFFENVKNVLPAKDKKIIFVFGDPGSENTGLIEYLLTGPIPNNFLEKESDFPVVRGQPNSDTMFCDSPNMELMSISTKSLAIELLIYTMSLITANQFRGLIYTVNFVSLNNKTLPPPRNPNTPEFGLVFNARKTRLILPVITNFDSSLTEDQIRKMLIDDINSLPSKADDLQKLGYDIKQIQEIAEYMNNNFVIADIHKGNNSANVIESAIAQFEEHNNYNPNPEIVELFNSMVKKIAEEGIELLTHYRGNENSISLIQNSRTSDGKGPGIIPFIPQYKLEMLSKHYVKEITKKSDQFIFLLALESALAKDIPEIVQFCKLFREYSSVKSNTNMVLLSPQSQTKNLINIQEQMQGQKQHQAQNQEQAQKQKQEQEQELEQNQMQEQEQKKEQEKKVKVKKVKPDQNINNNNNDNNNNYDICNDKYNKNKNKNDRNNNTIPIPENLKNRNKGKRNK